jgi:hypothetical protein
MKFSMRCPACRAKFPWEPEKGYPEFCPNDACSTRIAHDRADDDIVIPFIRHTATKATDQVYRDIESSSERRAEMAAADAGTSVEDMSGLKITDLRETRHEGAIAAPPLPAHLENVGSFAGGAAAEHGATIQAGYLPNRGAHVRTAIQNRHAERTGAVSDRPALETEQPGYRRRG